MTTDREFNPPEVCATCGVYYSYRRGQCYECWAGDEAEHADQKREERQIEGETNA